MRRNTYTRQLLNPTFKGPNTTGWQDRHISGLQKTYGTERFVVDLIKGWAGYADSHRARYDSGIGDDGFLGPAWAEIGASIRTLLNGEMGQLDCGTLDSFLCATLQSEGFNPDNL